MQGETGGEGIYSYSWSGLLGELCSCCKTQYYKGSTISCSKLRLDTTPAKCQECFIE